MAKILITGSTDGIGLYSAQLLASQGHNVYLHARNSERAQTAQSAVPGAAGILIGDLASLSAMKNLAAEANQIGTFDAVIHNAGLGPSANELRTTEEPKGLAGTFVVNSLAPYVLTALMHKPKRLLYLSSSLHMSGDDSLKDVGWKERKFSSYPAYNDSKLHDTMLALAMARRWPDVRVAALDPGWIATKMGGMSAPGKTETPGKAIADFAAGEEGVSGGKSGVYFNPQGVKSPHKGATNQAKQDELMKICEEFSGVKMPE